MSTLNSLACTMFSNLSSANAPSWRCVSAMHRHDEGAGWRGLDVAEETPLAIHYNGIAHAVMMGTPLDLEDFAVGFSIAEGIARRLADVKTIALAQRNDGIAVEIALAPDALHRFLARHRVRSLRGHTSCGICGIEDLSDVAAVTTAPVPEARPISQSALQNALGTLRGVQPLGARTHGAHAAAWVDLTGRLVLVREDVGRHNALDKLVGAALRNKIDFGEGFCLITSRCPTKWCRRPRPPACRRWLPFPPPPHSQSAPHKRLGSRCSR
jgi:FdhD protein